MYKTKEIEVKPLDFLKKAVGVLDFPNSDLELYISLVQLYKWVCPVCLTPYESRHAMVLHLRREEHGKVCRFCGKEFHKTDDLLDHILKMHIAHGIWGF